uniref:Uncharacterized protein n=1 Tax=Meloidogyne javanica TaxID=6303 RepID=A0A915LMC5_MELJA
MKMLLLFVTTLLSFSKILLTTKSEFCSSFGQFECNCGNPRCIDSSSVEDGVADCSDASDEIRESPNIPCGDAKIPRRGKSNFRRNPEEMPSYKNFKWITNFEEWPRNHQRCVCRLGFFRAPGHSACLPIESFPHLNVSKVVDLTDEYASGQLNCSRLVSDLSMMYPGIFLFRREGEAGGGEEKEGKIGSVWLHEN